MDGRMNPVNYLPAICSWLLIIGLPIIVGIAVRRLEPMWPTWIPWIIGVVFFAACVTFGEWIFRVLKLLIIGNRDRAVTNASKDIKLAQALSRILQSGDLPVSDVASDLDIEQPNELEQEAITLIRSCIKPGATRFDPEIVQAKWQELGRLMNRLRESRLS